MRKACFVFIFFLAFAFKGLGQYVPMLNDGAVWTQGIRHCTDGGFSVNCGAWSCYDFQLSGDTIINSKQYAKVYLPNNEWWPYAYLREDSGKVYLKYEYESEFPYYGGANWGPEYFIDTTEFVLYDFNLQVGDTFTTRIHKCIDISNPTQDSIQRLHYFVLTQIDTVTLNNGISRKRLHLENTEVPWGDNYAQTYYSTEWIEGIGSTFTFFYNEYDSYYVCGMFDAGFSIYSLACYTLNDTLLWGVPNCQLPTGVNEVIAPEKMEVYPNPTTGIITLKGINESADYSIYNVVGKLVKTGTTTNNQIDVGALAIGMYVLAVTEKTTGKIYRSRIIKQ